MKKGFSIVLFFHVIALLFMSARSVLGHFCPFLWFFVKTTIDRKSFTQNCDFFCYFEYFSTFLLQILSGGQLSIFGQFWSIFMSTL